MEKEFIFNINGRSKGEIKEQIAESHQRIPGLIFNYPPMSVWNIENGIRDVDPGILWADSNRYSMNLYIHIPFCRQKCSFCYYSVTVNGNDTDAIWEYLKCLEIEASRYAKEISSKFIDTVFIGGGTPSRLNSDQIKFLFEKVIGQFNLSKCREISYEGSPDSFTREKIDTMQACGVNRLTMGVQSLNAEILKKARRYDNPEDIIRTYYDMVESGIDKINLDFIAGIEKEGFESMKETMDVLEKLEKRPTQITLFTLSVREGAINHTTMKTESPYQLFSRSLELYRYAKNRLTDFGYWQYSRNLFPTDDKIFLYQDNYWGNNGYVLALGASGYSHSENYTYINDFNYIDYIKRIRANESTVQKSYALSREESVRRHLVLSMKHSSLDCAKFNSFYENGFDVQTEFKPIFECLEELGIIAVDGNMIKYASHGIDEADKYARLFYSNDVNRNIMDEYEKIMASKQDSFRFTI